MPKVLIADKMSPSAIDIFKQRGIETVVKTGMSEDEFCTAIADVDGLVVRSAAKPNAKIIGSGKKLKVIGRAGIGVDNIDIPAATQNGIIVMNTPFGNAVTTAEHAISMMMSLARNIPQASRDTKAGKWPKAAYAGTELFNKTLGVIGCGNIGSIAADRALGLKMKVVAFDPYLSAERAKNIGVEKVELDDLLARADFITLHTPATESTKGMINKDSIAKMKKGVRIINCARGPLIIDEDLIAAIESGHVAGAAIDVYASEPAKEHIFFENDKIINTPHLGASTSEAQENVSVQVAEQIADYLLTGAVTNALNTASVTAEEAPKLKPYMTLGAQIGSLAGQVIRSSITAVTIEYAGAVAGLNTKPLTAVILQGLLASRVDCVNMVNAPLIAKERGVDATISTKENCPGYLTKITLSVTSENQTRKIAGTLIGGEQPRIVEINDVKVEAEMGENMLYIVSTDKPGLVAKMGMALAENNINIATFSLGRTKVGGTAITLVQTDGAVDKATVEKVCKIDGIEQALTLEF